MSLCAFTMTRYPSQWFFVTHKGFIWSHNKFMYSFRWLFVTLAMTLCVLHNHIIHSKWLLCSYYDIVWPWNDSAWLHRDLYDILNDLLCILTMVCVSLAMSLLITITMIFGALTMVLGTPQWLCVCLLKVCVIFKVILYYVHTDSLPCTQGFFVLLQ